MTMPPSDPHQNEEQDTQQNEGSVPRSPIRPSAAEPLRKPIMPSMPKPVVPAPITPDHTATQEIDLTLPPDQRAAQAIERLRRKLSAIAEEYAQGKINRAQFDAIYHRYQEQRRITEMLVQRNPETDAWQSVVKSGHTNYLRDRFESHIESYALYHMNRQEQIIRTGHVQIPDDQINPILAQLKTLTQSHGPQPAAHRVLPNRRWVFFVPGYYSLAVVIFSIEPASAQIKMVQDIHHDFERANEQMLRREKYDLRSMVFPHRALFEL